jgi:hypothetical protein
MSEAETRFDDGNVSDVVRVGNTVRRVTGPWSAAVHALLRHLEAVGFARSDGGAAPRFLGLDERGREVLSFVEGETLPPDVRDCGDAVLAGVGRLLRRYHDAVAGFVPPPDTRWQFGVGAPTHGDVVCHNDVGPWNVVARGGQPAALIDWDLAAPAPRAWDVAHALWRFVPLYQDPSFGSTHGDFGTPAEQGRRAAVLCDAYGLEERAGLLDLVERRIRVSHDSLAAWAAAGVPTYVKLWRAGHGEGTHGNLAYLRHHRAEIERHLT